MTRRSVRLLVLFSASLVAAVAGWTLLGDTLPPRGARLPAWVPGARGTAPSDAPHAAARVWVCPMHPDVRRAEPGHCPECGMALVLEVEAEPAAHAEARASRARSTVPAAPRATPTASEVRPDPGGEQEARVPVVLDGRRQQLAGVRTVPVTRRSLARQVRAAGLVTVDETRRADITVKVGGWIEQLFADYTGRAVARGEPLFALYSPDLLAAQREYLVALDAQRHAQHSPVKEAREVADRLVLAARERLHLWDVPDTHIDEMARTGVVPRRVVISSPAAGVILEKLAVQGMQVTAGQLLYRLADLSRIWVEADVYEGELDLLAPGTRATVRIAAFPDAPREARLTFVSPVVDEATRTVRARFELPNPGARIRPGMFAAVDITEPARALLAVPADAVIDTGREQIVFVAEGGGYYAPRRVRTGRRVDGHVEVRDGLREGEQVAAAALFLLDSESQLRAAVGAYAPAAGAEPAGAAAAAVLRLDLRTEPDPPRPGQTTFEVTVHDASGQPVVDAEVAVTLSMPPMPAMNMPAMRSDGVLPHAGGGRYRGRIEVLMAGRWDVTLTVSRGGTRLGARQLTLVVR